MDKISVSVAARMMLFICLQVENTKRIKGWLTDTNCPAKDTVWAAQIRAFIDKHVVQYVSEAEEDSTKFLIVNTSCCPTITAFVWKVLTLIEERTIGNFLQHKWVA